MHSSDLYSEALPLPPRATLQQAADILNTGSRVAILAGRGCLTARKEIVAVAETLAAPIVKPLLGKAVVPDDHPYTTGGIGLLGTAPSQEVLEECDTLLIAGSSFPYLEFYPKPGQAKAVQIDLDPSRIGLRSPVDVGLVGHCWDVLRALLPLLARKSDRTFLSKAQERMQKWNELMEIRGTRSDLPLKPQVVARALNEFLDRDAIICSDTGTVTTWAARHIMIRGDMEFSVSGTLATMANALPYSIGAAVAFPGRQVVCFTGDGGLTMLMGELATIAKYRLPVKVIVIKNNVLGMIKWEQLAFEGNPQYGVQLHPIDFVSVARACGLGGYSRRRPRLGSCGARRSVPSSRSSAGRSHGRSQRTAAAWKDYDGSGLAIRQSPGERTEGPVGHHQDDCGEQDQGDRLVRRWFIARRGTTWLRCISGAFLTLYANAVIN